MNEIDRVLAICGIAFLIQQVYRIAVFYYGMDYHPAIGVSFVLFIIANFAYWGSKENE
jgi:hypothetical protein